MFKKKTTTLNSSQNVLQPRMKIKCQEKSPKSVIIYIVIENTTRTPRCGYRILVTIDVQLKLLYFYILRIYLISRFWQCLQVQVYLNKVQYKLLCCNTDTIQKPTYILYRQIPASIY